MHGSCVAQSLRSNLATLQKELRELYEESRMAAAQKRDYAGADQGGMVIKGK
jgi:hypothetical protein